MNQIYSMQQVASLFGLEVSRLRYWAQSGFINPSIRRRGRCYYTFPDLVALRTAQNLLGSGLTMGKVRRNLAALRALGHELMRPGQQVHIYSDGETVVAIDMQHTEEHHVNPVSLGNRVIMSLSVDTLAEHLEEFERERARARQAAELPAPANDGGDAAAADDETRVPSAAVPDCHAHASDDNPHLPAAMMIADTEPTALPNGSVPIDAVEVVDVADDLTEVCPAPPSAFECFTEGCAAEDRGDSEEAERLYRQALDQQETLAGAHTNLGNLLYRRGDLPAARDAYQAALTYEPDQAEARYNLGNLLDDLGEIERAISELRRVCWTHPDFPDAHYNLALILARIGSITQASKHFSRYLAIDGESDWAEHARAYLQSVDDSRRKAARTAP